MAVLTRAGLSCYILNVDIGEDFIILQEEPEKLWDILSDVANWGYLFTTTTGIRKIAPVFTVLDGEGAGMRFEVTSGKNFREVWRMEVWSPPDCLAASGRSFFPRCLPFDTIFALNITPVDPISTRIDFHLDMDSLPSPRRPKFVTLSPVKEMKGYLSNLVSRLPKLIERA